MAIKVNENAAKFIISKCIPLIKGACLANRARFSMAAYKGKGARARRGCYVELMKCSINNPGCSINA